MTTITYNDAVERFNAELDDNYPVYKILGATVSPSVILKNDDPAYREALNDFMDMLTDSDIYVDGYTN